MSVPIPPNAGQERQNRKLLEELNEKKNKLKKGHGGGGPGMTASVSSPMPVQPGLPGGSRPVMTHDTASPYISNQQRMALQHAQENSVGYFITQESSFGNLILPVLPRFEQKNQ